MHLQEKLHQPQSKYIKLLNSENTFQKGIQEISSKWSTIPPSELHDIELFVKNLLKNPKNKIHFKNLLQLVNKFFEIKQGERFIPILLKNVNEKQILIKSEVMNSIVCCAQVLPNELVQHIVSKLQTCEVDRASYWQCLQPINLQSIEPEILQKLLQEAQKDGVEIQGIQRDKPQPKDTLYFTFEEHAIVALQKQLQQKLPQQLYQGLFSYAQNFLLQSLETLKSYLGPEIMGLVLHYLHLRVLNNSHQKPIGLKIYELLSVFTN